MNSLTTKAKVAFATLLLLVSSSLFANVSGFFIDNSDSIILDKAVTKMKQMGEELYKKTGVSTVLIVQKHLDKKSFLAYKDKYLSKTKKPFVLWIFSKTYEDRKNIGLNQMFNSPELDDKFDKDSLFSPFTGTFTKILTVHKSKVDPTSAAFLNGFGDLVDMLANSYNIKLKSSLGSGSHYMTNIIRVIFYLFLAWALGMLLFRKIKG